jgi:hypothetical protein
MASAALGRRPLADDALSKLKSLSIGRGGRLQNPLRMAGSGTSAGWV